MWFLAAAASAADWSSEPQAVRYQDQVEVFSTVQFDTGYWPSPSDPISIRFYLTPTGGVTTDLGGVSELGWPPLAHHDAGAPGELLLDAGLDIGAEIQLDLFGLYSGVVPLATQSIAFHDGLATDDLLLPGAPITTAHLGDQVGSFPPLDYTVSVVPGISLVAGVDLVPTVAVDLTGLDTRADAGDQELVQTTAEGWVPVDPDPTRPGELGLVTTWEGELDSHLSLVLEPHIDVDTVLGTFSLVRFPLPVDLVDDSEIRTSAPVFAVHPLPVLETGEASHDFGSVAVGAQADWDLALQNLGEQVLQGAAGIEGDAAFSVWPDGVAALARSDDGLTVTFAPTQAGPFTAELWLETNDPYEPVVRLALSGVGVGGDPVPSDPAAGDNAPQAYCGCSSSAVGAGWWALGGALALGRRRRAK